MLLALLLVVFMPAICAIFVHFVSIWYDCRSFVGACRDLLCHGRFATAWDYMGNRFWAICYVRVETKDRKKFGGYAGRAACVSSSPFPRDVYLNNLWELDDHGCFISLYGSRLGAWVNCSDAISVELFEVPPAREGCKNKKHLRLGGRKER